MKLQKRVLKPLQALLETFVGPTRLIQKRQDKYLDYSASQQKAEKNKDPSRSKNVGYQNRNFFICKIIS